MRLQTKILAGYLVLVAVICSMAAILVHERGRMREIEAETGEIQEIRRDITVAQRSITTLASQVVGIVFYAGHHEKDGSDYTNTGIGQQKCHGYAVALQDATNDYCQWGFYGTELDCCPTDGSGNKQNNYSTPDIDWSGYAWTQKIITAAGGKENLNATEQSGYPATYYAVVDYENNKAQAPANSSGWFLPSIGQMWNVYQNRTSLFGPKNWKDSKPRESLFS